MTSSNTKKRSSGFTLMEMLIAISIVGLVLAVSVPASARFYQSMQYRQAVRDVVVLLATARLQAVRSGRPQDVKVDPEKRELRLNSTLKTLPEGVQVVVHSAKEINEPSVGVVRFYPEGGSSGGGIDIETPAGSGVRISIDWLVGRVSQEKYALN